MEVAGRRAGHVAVRQDEATAVHEEARADVVHGADRAIPFNLDGQRAVFLAHALARFVDLVSQGPSFGVVEGIGALDQADACAIGTDDALARDQSLQS